MLLLLHLALAAVAVASCVIRPERGRSEARVGRGEAGVGRSM